MASQQNQTERGNRSSEQTRLKLPRKYDVFVLNDDVTTFDFVEYVLVTIFDKDIDTAAAIAKATDACGRGLIGKYSLDIAHTKVEKATGLARSENYPLEFSIEPEQTDGNK